MLLQRKCIYTGSPKAPGELTAAAWRPDRNFLRSGR